MKKVLTHIEIFKYTGTMEQHHRINSYIKLVEAEGWAVSNVIQAPIQSGGLEGFYITLVIKKVEG